MRKMRIKGSLCMAFVLSVSILSGCSNKESSGKLSEPVHTTAVTVQTQEEAPSPAVTKAEPVRESVDFSKEFDGFNGCAVIYDLEGNKMSIYNEEMCEKRVSPFSTFKIVSTLMGLKNGVLSNADSRMKYSGVSYQMPAWNRDLTLKEAFEASCVWYYRQVIDGVGEKEVKAELEQLNYGNCDCSKWDGIDNDEVRDLKGFWLDSSLRISPKEQVQVLATIFEGKSGYTKEQVETLKNIMLVDDTKSYKVYGKTGTGRNGEGWYGGFAEKNGKKKYFAIYLEDSKREAVGATAKKIALSVLK